MEMESQPPPEEEIAPIAAPKPEPVEVKLSLWARLKKLFGG
jgi:hypothetical protein